MFSWHSWLLTCWLMAAVSCCSRGASNLEDIQSACVASSASNDAQEEEEEQEEGPAAAAEKKEFHAEAEAHPLQASETEKAKTTK